MATAILQRNVQSPSTVETKPGTSRRLDPADLRVTFPRVIRSEWVKFRSLQSNWLTLIVTALGILAFGAFASATYSAANAEADAFGNPITAGLSGNVLAQIVIGIVGVLAITSEFANGMIRSTFASVPKRLPVLWGKALVVAGVTFAVALPTMFAAFFLGQALIGGESASLTDDGVLRVVIGSAGYLTAVALLGLGLGTILRQAASAIGVIFVLLLLAPQLLGFLLPASAQETILKYLPSNAGSALTTIDSSPDLLSPLMGAIVLAGWVAGFLAIAAVLLKRRDA